MQEYSKHLHSVVTASYQSRKKIERHGKAQSVNRAVKMRMRKAKSRDIVHGERQIPVMTCPVCGSPLKGKQGCCVNCGTMIDESVSGIGYTPKPILPIERLLFLHLDVESGTVSYIESNSVQEVLREVDLKDGKIE